MTRPTPPPATVTTSVDPAEVARFSALFARWWEAKGPFAPLHRINPARLGFVRDRALGHFGRDPRARAPFAGLRLLDVGCGGGLLCEPMARLGFGVVGADPSDENIAAAREHAAAQGLAIDYRAAAAEALLAAGEPAFDVLLALEVVEHVADPAAFLRNCTRLLSPGGLMIVATLNRTLKSLVEAKLAAEYVLRWVPAGTHDWRRFLTPRELGAMLARPGWTVQGPFGLGLGRLGGRWAISDDSRVNYFMTAASPAVGALRLGRDPAAR